MQKIINFFSIISESTDEKTSLENENKLFGVIVSISMLIGSIASFLTLYYMLHENIKSVAFGSIILFGFAILFIGFSRIKNEIVKMFIYSILVSAILVFSYIQFYHVIGPAVWTISFLLMMIILVYSRIEMLIIFLATDIILNIYSWNQSIQFDNWSGYHPSQTMILITLSFATLGVFIVFKNRQKKIIEQFDNIRLSEEKLSSTLLSVGDGVITVNEKGLVGAT